jgi:hypothetical protein
MSLLSVAVDGDTVLFSCEATCGVAWSGCMSREERDSRRALSWPDTPRSADSCGFYWQIKLKQTVTLRSRALLCGTCSVAKSTMSSVSVGQIVASHSLALFCRL